MINERSKLKSQKKIVEFGQCRILKELRDFDNYREKNNLQVEFCEFVGGKFKEHKRIFKNISAAKAKKLLTSPAGSKEHFANAKSWSDTRFGVVVKVELNGHVIVNREFSDVTGTYFWILTDFSDDPNFEPLFDYSQNLEERLRRRKDEWLTV